MPGKVEHRAASGVISVLRNFLRGHDNSNALRFADRLAARTQPPPKIPGGPYHKTSKIYYFTRDGRREIEPPLVIPINQQIGMSGEVVTQVKPPVPGKVWES